MLGLFARKPGQAPKGETAPEEVPTIPHADPTKEATVPAPDATPLAHDAVLTDLLPGVLPLTPLDETPIAPGFQFRLDPEAGANGTWESPAGRLIHLRTGNPERPGRWFGLHLALPELADLTGLRWFGVFARTQAARPAALRLCLRSGRRDDEGGGFRDTFFARHLLAEPAETDHVAALAFDRLPDVPTQAPWRELIVFLPPTEPLDLVLHDLRIVVR